MVAIPEQQRIDSDAALQQLQLWYEMQQQLAGLKTSEVLLRKSVAQHYFPIPEEGTNTFHLSGGYKLQMVHVIARKPDENLLHNLSEQDMKKIETMAVPMAQLFKQHWTLSMTAYNSLTAEQRAFVDTLLDIKPSDTPRLAVVAPKEDAAPQETAPAPAADTQPAPAAPAPAPASETAQHAIHYGKEADTPDAHFFRDKEGTWWQLCEDWVEQDDEALLSELEAQWNANRPRRGRPRKEAK